MTGSSLPAGPRRPGCALGPGCQPGFCYGLDYLTQQAVALEEGRESSHGPGQAGGGGGAGDTAGDCVAVALRQGCAGLTQLVRKPASRYGEGAFAGDAQGEASARFQGPIQRFSTQIKTLLRGEEGGLTGAVLDTPQGEEEIPLDLVIALPALPAARRLRSEPGRRYPGRRQRRGKLQESQRCRGGTYLPPQQHHTYFSDITDKGRFMPRAAPVTIPTLSADGRIHCSYNASWISSPV